MKNRLLAIFGVTLALLVVIYFISNRRREGFTSSPTGADMFTLYYVDWCPHCKSVKPMFEDFAKNGFVTIAGKNVQVRAIECEKQSKEAEGKPIKGYPTFLLETAEGKTVEYQGDRSPEGWMKFLEEQLSAGSGSTP